VMSGGSGDDDMSGGNGDDIMIAGSGADQVRGQGGNDRIFAADDATSSLLIVDNINGGAGDDFVEADATDIVTSVEVRDNA